MAMERELLKNAVSKPCTLIYPFEKREMPKGNRGKHEYDEAKCTGCGMCSRVCPSFAIELKGLGPKCEGLRINLGACLFCQQCEESCPTNAIRLTVSLRARRHKQGGRDTRLQEDSAATGGASG